MPVNTVVALLGEDNLSTSDYRARADIWRLDPAGSLIPVFIIENRLGVENVREIARALGERNIGARRGLTPARRP